MASLVAQTVKNRLQCRRPEFNPWVGKIPWRRAWQLTPVFLPGESPWTGEPGGLQSMGVTKSRTRLRDEEHTHPGLLWWLSGRVCLPKQNRGFDPGSGKLPHAMKQVNLWAITIEPAL